MHYFLNFIKFPYVVSIHFIIIILLLSPKCFSTKKQPAVEEKVTLEPTLVPDEAKAAPDEAKAQELTPVEKAQECSSNAVPDEAKAAQCEQSAPGLLEISAQVDALCILFAVAIISKIYPPPIFFFPGGAKICGCFRILWKGSTTASRPQTSLYVLE